MASRNAAACRKGACRSNDTLTEDGFEVSRLAQKQHCTFCQFSFCWGGKSTFGAWFFAGTRWRWMASPSQHTDRIESVGGMVRALFFTFTSMLDFGVSMGNVG